MRKLVLGVMLGALMTAPALAGKQDFVYVVYGDQKERLQTGDLKTVEVCTVKEMVAELFDLRVNKFDLFMMTRRLEDDKTMTRASIYVGQTLTVKDVPGMSWQCT